MRKAFLKKCKPPPQVFSLIVSICSGPWPLVTLWGFTLPWEKKSPSFLAHHIRPWTPCLLSASAFLQAPATHPAGIIVPKYRLSHHEFVHSISPFWSGMSLFLAWLIPYLSSAIPEVVPHWSLSMLCWSKKTIHSLQYVSIEFSFLYSCILSRNIY